MQDNVTDPVQQEYLFALDIGTRSVIGIVGKMQHGLFHVVDTEYAEHDKRAMFDGQIEDIEQVARISGVVKERLETRLGFTFDSVCVAAAGRALRTCSSSFEIELDPEEAISSQTIYQLEMGAIGIAQDQVNSTGEGSNDNGLFCVGYSVVNYYLDNYRMTTILGHKGKSARADVISTFLPNQVVDSLRSAMALINLNIINITLEPIAAMNAVIPAELRLLNLALVDIGAGTSDIAVSDGGSVIAYTMATVAGDEITEYLMKRYLIDFETAERLKSAAGESGSTIEYNDILGFAYQIEREELLEVLGTPVESLADEICKRIVESNNDRAPVAVFLVGGGSKVPLLGTAVASRLGIDITKVAVGGSSYMKKQTSGQLDVSDPEYATPLGIAITAASYAEQNSMVVYVNDNKVQMMRSAGFTVMNALLMCGYKYQQMMGRSGKGLSFSVNGENMLLRGGLPRPAEITVNDKPASIATGLACGDRVIIMPSLSGEDATPCVGEYTKTAEEPTVTLDGIPCQIGEIAFIDGKQVHRDTVIEQDNDLTTKWVNSLGELTEHLGMDTVGVHFTINGQLAELTDLLRDGDVVLSEEDDYSFEKIKVIAETMDTASVVAPEPVQVTAPQPEPIVEPQPEPTHIPETTLALEPKIAPQPEPRVEPQPVFVEQPQPMIPPEPKIIPEPEPEPVPEYKHISEPQPVSAGPVIRITLNQREVELPAKADKMPYIFLDMLNLVDIDPTKPEGDIVLRVNGQNASYLQEIHQGDSVQIYWSNRGE